MQIWSRTPRISAGSKASNSTEWSVPQQLVCLSIFVRVVCLSVWCFKCEGMAVLLYDNGMVTPSPDPDAASVFDQSADETNVFASVL